MQGAHVRLASLMRRSILAVVAVVVVLGVGESAFGASHSQLRQVRGALLLTHPEHWQSDGSHGCVGSGLYTGVGPRTPLVVLSEDGSVLARTTLGKGSHADEGCRWAFDV